jgi:hypothetical protein
MKAKSEFVDVLVRVLGTPVGQGRPHLIHAAPLQCLLMVRE